MLVKSSHLGEVIWKFNHDNQNCFWLIYRVYIFSSLCNKVLDGTLVLTSYWKHAYNFHFDPVYSKSTDMPESPSIITLWGVVCGSLVKLEG